jgi:hypothetical protein
MKDFMRIVVGYGVKVRQNFVFRLRRDGTVDFGLAH